MTDAAIPDSHPGKREQGTLVDMVFRSATSPWGIASFRRDDGTVFCATGDFGQTVLYEEFILYGERVPDIEGGDFEVSQFTSHPPRSLKAISGYLAALTGAARSSTVKLVEHYGENTIDVLERSPDLIGDAGIPERDIERLVNGWKSKRSARLALAKVEIKGIPFYKLSKLSRYYGNDVDLNQLIKTDPYALYVHFDDLPFPKAIALANQLGVTTQSESAIRGAVIAALRREAWLGHSLIEGKQLGQLVVKLLRINPDIVRSLLPPAVAELRQLGLIHVEDRRVQLKHLHDAEQQLFKLIGRWSQLDEAELEIDLVPSEQMGLKMLKPMNLKSGDTKQLLTGLSALLSECCAIVQCQTYEDQLFVAQALALIFSAYQAESVFTTYTLEMVAEARTVLGTNAKVETYAELIGLDEETGIPLQRGANPIQADVIVVLCADALGIEEMNYLIEAAPNDGRLYLLGCPKDLPSLSIGQPFADLLDSQKLKAFHSRFWGIPSSAKREAQELIWAGTVIPNMDAFDPSQPISWLECSAVDLPTFIPELIRESAALLNLDPLADIRVVAHNTTHPVAKKVQEAIIADYTEDVMPVTFQGRQYQTGLPIVVRQPLQSSSNPAFSVYWPTAVTNQQMTVQCAGGHEINLDAEDRLDVFDALVMSPKFIRGRRYELVVLLATGDQCEAINLELLSSLINTSIQSLIIVGEITLLAQGIADRPTSRTRSKLLNWVTE